MSITSVLKKAALNLKIIPVTDHLIPVGVPFIAMFNPESIAIHEDIEWNSDCGSGNSGSDMQYQRTKPRTFTLEFIIDGTGVNTDGIKIPVTIQVALFREATTALKGIFHRPDFLLVQYGTFICACVLNSSNVTYTMFDQYGLPVRAKISASFTERTPGTLQNILNLLSSPDLTHQVEVKDGDILPLLTYKIYNNQNYYLQVAKVNKLKNFRKLKAGSTLIFPPIADKKAQ